MQLLQCGIRPRCLLCCFQSRPADNSPISTRPRALDTQTAAVALSKVPPTCHRQTTQIACATSPPFLHEVVSTTTCGARARKTSTLALSEHVSEVAKINITTIHSPESNSDCWRHVPHFRDFQWNLNIRNCWCLATCNSHTVQVRNFTCIVMRNTSSSVDCLKLPQIVAHSLNSHCRNQPMSCPEQLVASLGHHQL